MSCASCGSENLPSARFCAACGTKLDGAGVLAPRAPARAPAVVPRPPGRFVGAEPLFVCSRCGRPMRPAAYFSRGANIAKAVLLMIPFSFFGPLLFFLLRKDRLICSICKGMLHGEAAVPLLQAFSPSLPAAAGIAGGLTVYDPEEDVTVLERQSRRQRARAWTWGAISAGILGTGVLVGAGNGLHASVGLLVLAMPPGIGALLAAFRSKTFARQAEEKRGREHRARVLELAHAHGGRLNVSLVAAELRLDLADAERLLSGMVDGQRVEMEVDDGGRISYVFTELAGS